MTEIARVRIERDGETIARGAQLPSGTIVVEWNREAFPIDERTAFPVESRYRTVEDAEEASGGRVIVGYIADLENVDERIDEFLEDVGEAEDVDREKLVADGGLDEETAKGTLRPGDVFQDEKFGSVWRVVETETINVLAYGPLEQEPAERSLRNFAFSVVDEYVAREHRTAIQDLIDRRLEELEENREDLADDAEDVREADAEELDELDDVQEGEDDG